MLGRDAAALAGRLAAGDPAFDWQPLATFMAAASAPDETREAAATHEARAFAVSEEQEEEEARAAAAPPAVRSQDGAPGSSTAAPIELHDGEEDATPGGTAPLPPAPPVAGQQGQPSSSAPLHRDPAAVPAKKPGTRPPSRLDEAAWGAYVYKNNKTETWRATWGFSGDTKKYDLKVKKDETISNDAKRLPSKEAAAMIRFETLLTFGELDRIPWDLREFYKKRKALDSIAERALLADVRAVVAPRHGVPDPFGEWQMVQQLAKRPCRELAQLVVLAAKLAPAIESQEDGQPAPQGDHGQGATQAMTAATAASTQPAVLSTQEVAQLAQQPEWVDECARYGECEEDEEEDGEEEGEEEEEEEVEEGEEGEGDSELAAAAVGGGSAAPAAALLEHELAADASTASASTM